MDNLHVNFTTGSGILEAVRGVGFSLDKGEILGIVGESGSGKSVTAHALMRLVPPNGAIIAGAIAYRGRDIAALGPEELRAFRGREVAMIFQEPGRSFDPIYSIGRSLAETLRAHEPGLSDDEVRARSIRLLEEVHVSNPESRLDNFPHQFSGGLLQRIMIAHALAGDPAVLIADEPTTALDVTIQAGVIDLLRELRLRRGLAIIFITHNLALISGFADRLVVMYAGMVMEEGPVDTVIRAPRHPYTAGLLGSLVPFGTHHSEHPLHILAGTPPDPTRHEAGCPFAPRCPLVTDACHTEVPEIREDAGVRYRCIIPGAKTVATND
ncbi:MAG: ABC transporter ATP-binding protein [Spirochaeta sp.]|nr:ABC transporter ATP-binding protein [Spirochaeta sp.]